MWRSLPSTSQRAKVVNTVALASRCRCSASRRSAPRSRRAGGPRATGCRRRRSRPRARSARSRRACGRAARSGRKRSFCSSVPNMCDALEADRLVDAEHDRERRVDLGEGLEDARVAGLREALAAVALGDVEAAEPAPRRARGSRRRRSSAPPRSCAGRMRGADLAQRRRSAPRIRSCSAGSGCGHGKTSSSWISPRNSDLANDETARSGLVLDLSLGRRLHPSHLTPWRLRYSAAERLRSRGARAARGPRERAGCRRRSG